MRTYTTKEVCSVLKINKSAIATMELYKKPGVKVGLNTWNADMVDGEAREREYRKKIYKEPPRVYGGGSY